MDLDGQQVYNEDQQNSCNFYIDENHKLDGRTTFQNLQYQGLHFYTKTVIRITGIPNIKIT